MSGSDGTSDRSLLLVVGYTLTGEVSGTSLRDLEDDGGLVVASGFKSSDDGRGGGDVLRKVEKRVSSQSFDGNGTRSGSGGSTHESLSNSSEIATKGGQSQDIILGRRSSL